MSTMKRTGLPGGKRIARTSSSTRPSQPPTDFIALGTKPKDVHRISGSDIGIPSGKKPKLHSGPSTAMHHFTMAPSRLTSNIDPISSRMSPTIPEPNTNCIDCPPADLLPQVMKNADVDPDQVEGLICGAVKTLRMNKSKPDAVLLLSLLCLARERPDIFVTEPIIESFCTLLKRDPTLDSSKTKGATMVAVLACNILNAVLQGEDWPEILLRVYLDDALCDRIWADHKDCQNFVGNILKPFDTKLAAKLDEDTVMNELASQPIPRFSISTEKIHSLTVDILKERLSRRLPDTNPMGVPGVVGSNVGATGKNLIRTLTSVCGVQEIRCMAVQKLEIWLQNPKLVKVAQDLLLSICINCKTQSQEDVDTIGHLTKMRIKAKPVLNYFLTCLKELVESHSDNLKTLLSYVLYNELSNARNPGNMSVVVLMLQTYPEKAAKTLASVCQDLLLQQEDYLRAVRALLREIVRAVKHEIQFSSFALGLMQEPDMEKFSALDQHHKERFISSTSDLICLSMLLSITPQAKEGISVINGKKKPADSIINNHEELYVHHKHMLAEIQHNALWWLHVMVVPHLNSRISPTDFMQTLQKILFLKSADLYHTRDNWPPEGDRVFLVKSCHEVPVLEGSVLRLAAIGLSPDHPLQPAESLDLIGQLIRRAAVLVRQSYNPISVERQDLIDTILALCQYHHPENIKLPTDYIPPSLAISQLYWSALQNILILICLNPATVGQQAWTTYPMIKVLMEMCVVNRFTYPPVTVIDEDLRNQMTGKEHQMSLVEKSEILEFESHLAAVTTRQVITEESSLLLSQLIAMDPQGHPRRPPDRILEQLGQLSSRLQLGVWLCRSRQPDFLLDIINRHSDNQSMSWLPDLVASTQGDVALLPVQCLCEFLLVKEKDVKKLVSGGIRTHDLVSQLRSFFASDSYEESVQVIHYFLKRICSPQMSLRERAKEALSLILSAEERMETDEEHQVLNFSWLLRELLNLPHYVTMLRSLTVDSLHKAILIDPDPMTIAAYVTFIATDLRLAARGADRERAFELSAEAAKVASHLIIDRRVIVESILSSTPEPLPGSFKIACQSFVASLLEIFITHIKEAQEQDAGRVAMDAEAGDRIPWSDSQDEIFVKWPDGQGAATFHFLIIQASVVLLGYGPLSFRCGTPVADDAAYQQLMAFWFNEQGLVVPQAFLMDTQEEALLLPDWLRLRMLRSEVMSSTRQLALAAVRDLEVEAMILFVQSFGIPVESMDLLLQRLDAQSDTNAEAILAGTSANRSYMIRLIEVQRMRGCQAGSKFSDLLKSSSGESLAASSQARPSVIQIATPGDSQAKMEVDPPFAKPLVGKTRDRPLPRDSLEMKETLLAIFSDATSYADMKFLMQGLKQGKSPLHRLCVDTLRQLSNSDEFLQSMFAFTSRACSLMRVLERGLCAAKRNDHEALEKFSQTLSRIHDYGKKANDSLMRKSRPLMTLASNWQVRHTSSSKGIRPRRLSSTSESDDNLRQSDWSRLEEFLREQMVFLDDDREIKSKVALVARILLEEISHRRALIGRGKSICDDVCFTSIGTSGLLIDWLQLLDPELLAHCPELQRKLLFDRNDQSNSGSVVFNQAYLLSLLVQHCSWSTINSAIQWLMGPDTRDPTDPTNSHSINADPKTALDFLWVVMQAPKIWQGRENKSTSVSEPVLRLTPGQFCRLLSYMVVTTADAKPEQTDDEDRWQYMELFTVYFSKFGQDHSLYPHLENIIDFLVSKLRSSTSTRHKETWWKILAQLYILKCDHPSCSVLLLPNKGLNQSELDTFADVIASASVGSNCRSDALVCSLLNRLGYVRSNSNLGSQVDTSMITTSFDAACDANLILCKMATSRPFIVLRQIDLISSMLRGRTRHDFAEFKAQHHLPFMLNIATLLIKLSPYVFRKRHESAVSSVMEIFWQMVRNYCHRARRQMLPVFRATLSLTLEYLTHSVTRATAILSKHYTTFQALLKTYSDHENIVSLVNSIQSVVGTSWSTGENPLSGAPRPPVLSLASTSSSQAHSVYLDLLAEGQDLENVVQALADFDESSKRRVDDLTPFLEHLERLFVTSKDRNTRKAAVSAAVRHARSNPEYAAKFFPYYLRCLTEASGNDESETLILSVRADPLSHTLLKDTASGVRDAVSFLPEMTILCRDDAIKLLGAAFDASLRCGAALAFPDTAPESRDICDIITRCLWLLRGLNETQMKGVSP